MQLFISWSGDQSKHVGAALRDWIPMVLHYVEPWLSATDIDAGDRWAVEVGQKLSHCSFGILCLTRTSLISPWVLFEAGALSKSVETGSVVPYLIDLDFADVTGPLAQFQAKKADKASTLELVRSINSRHSAPQPDVRVADLFELLWPRLEAQLRNAPATTASESHPRSQREILEDLTEAVRAVERRTRVLDNDILAQLFSVAEPAAPSAWELQARELIARGDGPAAIGLIRRATGLGLKEAKDIHDAWAITERKRVAGSE